MDNFLKMDIFFAVTTVAVVVIAVLLSMVLIRLLRVLDKVEQVTTLVHEESEQIRNDIREVRARVKEEAVSAGKLLGILGGFVKPKRRRARKSTAKEPS